MGTLTQYICGEPVPLYPDTRHTCPRRLDGATYEDGYLQRGPWLVCSHCGSLQGAFFADACREIAEGIAPKTAAVARHPQDHERFYLFYQGVILTWGTDTLFFHWSHAAGVPQVDRWLWPALERGK